MRSTTSCFNSTLYRKTMARFWPLWALYGLIWLFLLPFNLLNQYFDCLRWSDLSNAQADLLQLARAIPQDLEFGVFLSLVFGVLCAMAVFGYLYNNRSACMLHALPLRRETLFATNYLAGLSFLLLPHLAVAAITAAVELALLPSGNWGEALPSLGIWLLAQSGTALFFFSFAAFCAMFTGHSLALPAFYGIFNCLVIVLYTLITELMARFFYGYPSGGMGGPVVMYCTPVYALAEACSWDVDQTIMNGVTVSTGPWYLQSPGVVAAYAAAGVVLAVLALLVYRCRHVESAGDVVAIPLVRPLFKYGVAFCSGLCLGIVTAAFFGWENNPLPLSLCVILWAVVGYFAAEMLLKKSFRVFRAWAGALVTAVVLAALCLVCFLDLFGVEARVPAGADVASLAVSGDFSYPYDSGMGSWSEITDPDQIQEFLALHQAILAEQDRKYGGEFYEPGNSYLYLSLTYTLKNGSTLKRCYSSVPVFADEVDTQGTVTYCAAQLLQDRALVEASYHFDAYEAEGRLVEAWLSSASSQDEKYVDNLYLDGYADRLWQAVRQDFDEGTIGVRYLFDDQERQENTYVTDLCFSWERTDPVSDRTYTTTFTITLTPNAGHTLAVLEETGIWAEGYALQPHTSSGS